MRRLAAIVGLILGGALIAAPAVHARDAIVESFDDTPIVTHFFPAPGLADGERAPTIMLGHGWGGSGATSAPAHYAAAGYNVLTWDARGFGGSGGTVMIDHPEFEARDVQALIDFLAEQPEAQLDSAGDPRVGMDGPSYGGGIQFISAARDDRIDAIAPTIAWNTLTRSLYQAQSLKTGWGLALAGLGVPTSLLPGVLSPAGIQTGAQAPQFFDAVTSGLATGRFSAGANQWFADHGPEQFLDQMEAPTLIAQGTVDTLFTLEEAHRNYQALKANGVPLKMMWFCGGHGACLTASDAPDPISGIAGDTGRVIERKLAWFARWLKGDEAAEIGPAFEWIDEGGSWHASDAYPLKEVGSLTGSGSGSLVLTPGVSGSGLLIFATPSLLGLTIPLETPPPGSDVVGEPHLTLTYEATGVSLAADGDTHVFAQLIDKQRNLVVNNFATPIKIDLDGQSHTVEVDLERIASLSTPAGYELQIIPQTNVYDLQRATGLVQISNADIELPLVEPVEAAEGPCANLVEGTRGADRLRGTGGADTLRGKLGRDRLRGKGGADCLKGGRGRDRLNCGPGRDVAFVKGADRLSSCERVRGGRGR